MNRNSVVVAALLLTGAAAGGCASAGGSSPGAEGWIRAGETRSGTLSAADPVKDDGSYYDEWRVSGREGERLQIDLRSQDFDAYLTFGMRRGGVLQSIANDDDGAGGTDSRVTVTLPATGEYVITANSLFEDEAGKYTLSVASLGQAPPRPALSEIRTGQAVEGTLSSSDSSLDDGSYYDDWAYEGRAGERIRITMRASEFDTYLSFGYDDGGGYHELESDDDGAGGTDSEIDVTLDETRRYVIRANSLGGGETGRYSLNVMSVR